MKFVLESRFLRVTVDPARGGHISSLEDRRAGREWLWKNPYLEEMPVTYGESFVERLDTGGWVEIFPSVAPCRVGDLSVPDHGDLVSLPWELISSSTRSLEMAVTTRFAPCRFTTRLSLEDDLLRLDYRLENTGRDTIPYLWCAHPLFALEPGMEIKLPSGTGMKMAGGADDGFKWPHAGGFPPLHRIPDPDSDGFEPFAVKMFTDKETVGEVSLVTGDGRHSVTLKWDVRQAPFLGLWLNCGKWSGCGSPPYFNLGMEPATAPFDSLGDAMENQIHRLIGPGECVRWSLDVAVSTRDAMPGDGPLPPSR